MTSQFETETQQSFFPRGLHALGKRFVSDTSGAVTVDWVVLTAAIVGLGIAVLTSVSGGTKALASNTGDAIAAMEVGGSLGAAPQPNNPYGVMEGMLECNGNTCTLQNLDTQEVTRFANESGQNFTDVYSGGEISQHIEY